MADKLHHTLTDFDCFSNVATKTATKKEAERKIIERSIAVLTDGP